MCCLVILLWSMCVKARLATNPVSDSFAHSICQAPRIEERIVEKEVVVEKIIEVEVEKVIEKVVEREVFVCMCSFASQSGVDSMCAPHHRVCLCTRGSLVSPSPLLFLIEIYLVTTGGGGASGGACRGSPCRGRDLNSSPRSDSLAQAIFCTVP